MEYSNAYANDRPSRPGAADAEPRELKPYEAAIKDA
jgi:hypothetical protein